MDFYFPYEHLKPALTMSLLSVWVLVGLFHYLNHYTKRRYFTIWTAAWLFYAVWLTLWIPGQNFNSPLIALGKNWAVGASATFLIWGSISFLKLKATQRMFGGFLLFLAVWSYCEAIEFPNEFWVNAAMFIFIGLASMVTGWAFYQLRKERPYLGAGLLSFGFGLWGCYLVSHPWFEANGQMISAGFFISAVILLFIAVSMIVLVLEEVKTTTEETIQNLKTKTTETAILRSKVISTEERYRSLFEQASEGIIITEPKQLRILELNQTAKRLLGVNGDPAQHSFSSFCNLPSKGQPTHGADWFNHLRNQRIEIVRRDGTTIPAEVEASSIQYDGTQAYQFFIREMTERAKLEQQLRQAEKLSALGQMISGVAHELNNPLAVVKGYLELVLNRHELAPQTRTDLERVAHESNRATKLVQNFLTFAREQAVEQSSVQINELIRRILDLRQFDFRIAGIDLQQDLAPNLPVISACEDQLQQVLINLLHNAVQAMADFPGQATLKVSTEVQEDGMIRIMVEDSGPGVPESALPHIFEPFFTTKPVGTGTGLGLSIAHGIVADHKGKIYYQKSSLGGAGFVLLLPVQSSDEQSMFISTAEEPSDTKTSMQPELQARILILDDEASIAELLGEMLELLGHSPVLCNSPFQALNILKQQTFDLVLSDFRMPGMNGQEFYGEAIKLYPHLANRFVFLTGDVVTEETQMFIKSTGNPHLSKPFQLKDVEELVVKIVSSSRKIAA